MALTTIPLNEPSVPKDTAEIAEGATTAPNDTTEVSEGATSAPNNTTEVAEGNTVAPNNMAEVSEGATSAPANLTEIAEAVTGAPNELGIEPTTNIVQWSQETPDAYWFKSNVTVNATGLFFPVDGSDDLHIITSSSTASLQPRLTRVVTVEANEEYTLSFYLRASQLRYFQAHFNAGEVTGDPHINFDCQSNNQAITATDAEFSNEQISAVGVSGANQVARASFTFTPITTTLTLNLQIILTGTTNRRASESHTTGDALYLTGIQLEKSPNVTSYLKTEATAPLTEGQTVAPINLAEVAEGATSAPSNTAEVALGATSAPNNLAEVTVAGFPRTFRPLVSLNFAQELYATNDEPKAFDDILAYTRNDTASFWNRRLNRNGKWETFLDTDYVGNVENLALNSESFSSWTNSAGLTLVQGADVAPDGSKSAVKMVCGTTNIQHEAKETLTVTDATVYTLSIYAKKAELSIIGITFNSAEFDTPYRCLFDLNGGVALTDLSGTDYVSVIEYVGNDWYRISLTSTTIAAGAAEFDIELYNGATVFLGDGVSGTYIWGAQITESAKPLPYVKTISAAVTETFTEQPRIEYDPITAEPLGLLTEGESTNLLVRSEEIDNASWIKISTPTVNANQAIAPDGTKSMDELVASTTSSSVYNQPTALTANTDYTVSVYIKNIDSTRTRIGFYDVTGADYQGQLSFDWTGGVPSTQSTTGDCRNVTYDHVGNGIYRISFTSASDTVNVNHRVYITPDSSVGTNSIYVWGAQLEEHALPTSYIRTEGASVQRLKDTMSGSSGLINEAQSSITLRGVAKQKYLPDTQRFITSLNLDGTAQSFLTSTTGDEFRHRHGDTASSTNFNFTAGNIDQFYDSVLTFDGSTSRLFVNGAFDISNADIGGVVTNSNIGFQVGANDGSADASHWMGHIKLIEWYDEALTDQEVSLL